MLAEPTEITRVLDANRCRDIEAWLAAMAPNFSISDPFGTTTDPQVLRDHLRVAAENWRDFDYEILDYVRDGDRIAASYRLSMTGLANGFEGQTVSFTAAAMVRLKDGRVCDWQEWFDTGTFRRVRRAGMASSA